jgi:cytochrome c peroxidase
MRKLFYIIIVIAAGSVSFININGVQSIKEKYLSDFDELIEASRYLKELDQVNMDDYLVLRKKFKTIEPIFDYFYHEENMDFVNGAPLPKIERNAPNLVIKEPHGLQVIDEIMADSKNQVDIKKELNELYNFLIKQQKIQRVLNISYRHMYEINKLNIVRIFTLSLSGFDTPGTLNGINDAKYSMEAMLEYNNLAKNDLEFSDSLIDLHRLTTDYLKNHLDFNQFDRALFFRTLCGPLYKEYTRSQRDAGIEFINETSITAGYWNDESEEIFSTSFFNTYSFLGRPEGPRESEVKQIGKKLFFDNRVSSNGQLSCGTCHIEKYGYAEPKAISEGTDHVALGRNAPGLINSIYSTRFGYDLFGDNMERQITKVITNTDEFDHDYNGLIIKIGKIDDYKEFFNRLYPSQGLTKYTIVDALSTYIASLSSFNSPFDKYMRGTDALNKDAISGFNLFMGKAACGTCHFAPTFAGLVPPFYEDTESEVLGIPLSKKKKKLDADLGRYDNKRMKEKAEHYKYSFKTTTTRNTAYTAPYFHNGVFKSIKEVIAFYNKGGGEGHGYTVPMQTLSSDPLNLSRKEKKQLTSFLLSLNDPSFTE